MPSPRRPPSKESPSSVTPWPSVRSTRQEALSSASLRTRAAALAIVPRRDADDADIAMRPDGRTEYVPGGDEDRALLLGRGVYCLLDRRGVVGLAVALGAERPHVEHGRFHRRRLVCASSVPLTRYSPPWRKTPRRPRRTWRNLVCLEPLFVSACLSLLSQTAFPHGYEYTRGGRRAIGKSRSATANSSRWTPDGL